MCECSGHVHIEIGNWGSRLVCPNITTPAYAILVEHRLVGHVTRTFSSHQRRLKFSQGGFNAVPLGHLSAFASPRRAGLASTRRELWNMLCDIDLLQ